MAKIIRTTAAVEFAPLTKHMCKVHLSLAATVREWDGRNLRLAPPLTPVFLPSCDFTQITRETERFVEVMFVPFPI